ncbi:hypothetical protein CYLTODRAFT_423473 [Cylindrobasidium torrendii FP15055 ss-10]|uniref:Uncharacterized protein n=1 Tax=Cylindrobasidium torrendii FP15055 ss-10 TaxID=1314674 RepID=A0A0D7B7D4_9AGAR|nr:hypothetical protein CYLTODRAFT_423473 [Cylindrobasidium torrendii FP15055 ss-10]
MALSPEMDPGYGTGYETADSTKRNRRLKKKRSKNAVDKDDSSRKDGYETDDGYVSSTPKKQRSRFFRMPNRSKTNVDRDEEERIVPPVPALPTPAPTPFRLPIAARFATTLGDINAHRTVDPPQPTTIKKKEQPSWTLTPDTSLAATLDSVFGLAEAPKAPVREPTVEESPLRKDSMRTTASTSTMGSSSESSSGSFFSKFSGSTPSSSTTSSPVTRRPPISYPLTRAPSPQQQSPPPPPTILLRKATSASNVKQRNLTVNTDNRGASNAGSSFVMISPIPEGDSTPSPRRQPFFGRPINPPSPNPSNASTIRPDPELLGATPTIESRLSPRPNSPGLPNSPRAGSPARAPSPSGRSRSPGLPRSPRAPAMLAPTRAYVHRDLPTPSPPPTMALPSVPSEFAQAQAQAQRQIQMPVRTVQDKARIRAPSPMGSGNVPQRGRESPFPVAKSRNAPTAAAVGLDARVPRYRELQNSTPQNGYRAQDDFTDDDSVCEDAADMQDVLERFSSDDSGSEAGHGHALERKDSTLLSPYQQQQQVRFAQPSRSSVSVYSVASTDDGYARKSVEGGQLLDESRSEETRGRFVKRVGEMYEQNGREMGVVPAVPRVPAWVGERF